MADTVLIGAWKRFSSANRRLQQFGQGSDTSTFNGATGCTHTVLQRLIKAKTGANVTHDQISKIAGYPYPVDNKGRRGMTTSEMQRVVNHYNLPIKLKMGATWLDIIEGLKRGPVVIGILYGYWPEQKGSTYYGSKADGKPGGFAYRHGKTQLTGAEGVFHAILLFGRKKVRGTWRVLGNEPNHGSPNRPEKPDWDAVKSSYAHRAYDQYASTGRTRFAWLPTTTFKPKGY